MRRSAAHMLPGTRKLPLLYVLASMFLITLALYWAKAVLIPVAFAILLAFILRPVVQAVQRLRVGRVPAVILVVGLVFVLLAGMGWTIVQQVSGLTDNMPRYGENLKRKIVDLRGVGKGLFLEKAQTVVQQMTEEFDKGNQAGETKPIPVVVQAPSLLWSLPTLLEPLSTAGLVITLVIFMLLERGDLRNRVIRLVGYGRLTLATKALDEAGRRISRYLLMQSLINGSYGVAIGLGLFLIGLPYALLWGTLAAALRFIPYLGPVAAALFPIALSLAEFPSWQQPLLVIGLIVVLELAANMLLEPVLYGRTAGVSTVPLMVAIAFWTWLWGPIGLLLATPLTVSLGVLGRYVPQMEFLGILLSDEPVLEPHTGYYQRLVAQDQDEAADLVEEFLKTHTLAEAYEAVLIPALSAAKKDLAQDNLSAAEEEFIVLTTRELVEELSLRPLPSPSPDTSAEPVQPPDHVAPVLKVPVIFSPVHDQADELALLMLQQLLDPARYEVELLSASMLTAEVVSRVEESQVQLICLGGIAPGGVAHTRYLCKRLRTHCPTLKIVVGHWGSPGNSQDSQELLHQVGANAVGTTLQDTCTQLTQLGSLNPSPLTAADV
jgi:predicted PurR-regulated permease PerM